MRHRHAFTVVELLVVISIIIVLIALLSPALDKAVYEAEMVVDLANVKGLAAGSLVYAMDHKRYYPDRREAYMANGLQVGTDWTVPIVRDYRPMLMPYMSLRMMLDPFCGGIDLSIEASDADAQVFSDYDLWFGRQLSRAGVVEGAMRRVGDRLRWGENEFNVLAGDHDRQVRNVNAYASHPDQLSVMSFLAFQNEAAIVPSGMRGVGAAPDKWTLSRWQVNGTHRRGLVDHSYAFDDSSARRFNDVNLNDSLDSPTLNDGFGTVPNIANGSGDGAEWVPLPTVGR